MGTNELTRGFGERRSRLSGKSLGRLKSSAEASGKITGMKDLVTLVPGEVWPWIALVVIILVVAVAVLVVAAFRQGREIAFWPPRIGPRSGTIPGATAAAPITDINGTWYAYDAEPAQGSQFVSEAVVKQQGSLVTMELHRIRDRSGATTSRRYRYQGRFSARQLVLLFESIDRPDYIIGALVLLLNAQGDGFSGVTVYYDQKAHSGIITHRFWLCRSAARPDSGARL
ncbi:MAG: hypothetical protein ACRDFA_00175 [bacterium]